MSEINVYPRIIEQTENNLHLPTNGEMTPIEQAFERTGRLQPITPGVSPVTTKIESKPASSKKGQYTNITTGTTATRIVSENPERVSLLIRNTSSTAAYIGFDRGITTSTGLLLNQNDTYEINQLNLYKGEIFGIVASGTADIRIIEF